MVIPFAVGDLPRELCVKPQALIAFTGLDVNNNPVHKAIWESFSLNRRPDRAPLEFLLLEETHLFPTAKQKRSSYEWYVPKGLLKTNWLHKHLYEIPSVYVLYLDLDWDHPQWTEVLHQCAQRVQALRNHLHRRTTRVCLVLIQRNTALPPGEDVLAAERATALCNACDLTPKSLFVLPQCDHLLGYTTRLEIAFSELAKNYYNHEARAVKSHQDFLSKTTHQLLFVRHQFKMGFLNELKQDLISALKHYKQAYNNLMEVRVADTNMLEIKTVGGFINFKICKLSFLNTPLEAISHFRKHLDTFKQKEGCKELLFEHSAWISKQFEHFGDLFDDAIKQGLTAIQTQHPGFYYQQAANHAILRKQHCYSLCQNVDVIIKKELLANDASMEFYGQRPWRPSNQSIDPPDPQKEKDGIQALQHREITTVNHSKLIIPLLNNAVGQFKKYRCPRMKRYLMVQMGEEYFHNQEYGRALALLTKVSWDYRMEKWWGLLTSIQKTALKCAYLSANIKEYVTLALEMIGNHIYCCNEEKIRIQMNMNRVLSREVPEQELGCLDKCVEKAKELWKQSIANERCIFTVEVNNMLSFVECRTRFTKTSFRADEQVTLKIHLRTVCPFPIKFSKLCILFNNPVYNDNCVVTCNQDSGNQNDLYLEPMKPCTYSFSLIPNENDVDKDIHIMSVVLHLGSEISPNSHCAVLHWSGGGCHIPPNAGFTTFESKCDSEDDSKFSLLSMRPFTRILQREPKICLEVKHEPPVLNSEFYPVRLIVNNAEENDIQDLTLTFKLSSILDVDVIQNSHICEDEAVFTGNIESDDRSIKLPNLPSGGQAEKVIYLKMFSNDNRQFDIELNYKVDVVVDDHTLTCSCKKVDVLNIDVIDPFQVIIKPLDVKFEDAKRASSEEPFILLSTITCTSPWPIVIETSHLGLSTYVNTFDKNICSQLDQITLKINDEASECICVVAPNSESNPVPLGSYTLQWKRVSSEYDSIPFVQTTVSLPSLIIDQSELFIEAKVPASGLVRTTLPVSYVIHNRASCVQEVEIVMDSSEAFMFSGHKQLHFRLLPRDKETLNFNLYPLLCGYVQLPRMRINLNVSTASPTSYDQQIQRMIPSHVYIMPQGKTPRNAGEKP
ncbi:TRAPPC11 (predicted) [Pycnogonum litorale]